MLKENISNAEYHGSGELSRSTAWSLLTTCPQKVRYDMTHRKESSPALVIGSAFHAATLEPGKFDDEFAVKPSEIDGKSSRTDHYKETFKMMQKNEPNKSWLAPSDYDLVMDMAASALDHPILRTNMAERDTIIEGTGYFECGAKCKVRPDLYNPGAGVVIDLKSTQDASEKGFAKSVRQFGYTFQACWYMHALRLIGEKPKQFIFLAVEKSAPHLTAAYTLSATDIDKQMANMEKACKLWATCESSGVWPSYTDDVTTLDLGSLHGNNRLNVMQMADKFGVSRTYVYRIIRTHNLETKNIGNRRTIDITDFANAVRRDEEGKAA